MSLLVVLLLIIAASLAAVSLVSSLPAASSSPRVFVNANESGFVRTSFTVDASPSSERRYSVRASGLGFFTITVDGRRLGGEGRVFDPPISHYSRQVYFVEFDLGDLSSARKLTKNLKTTTPPSSKQIVVDMEILLGGGRFTNNWYNGFMNGTQMALWLEVVDKRDNERVIHSTTLNTSAFLCTRDGPIVESTIFGGEIVDFRRTDDSKKYRFYQCGKSEFAFSPTLIFRSAKGIAPMKVVRRDAPVRQWRVTNMSLVPPYLARSYKNITSLFLDFGTNDAGVLNVSLTLDGKAKQRKCGAGTSIVLSHAEILYESNMTLDRFTLGAANATDVFIIGEKSSSYSFQPRFTRHGFRYAQLFAVNTQLAADDPRQSQLTHDCLLASSHRLAVHRAVTQNGIRRRLHINTTNAVAQSYFDLSARSIAANLQNLPTDCCQRDEQLGWQADVWQGAQAATLLLDADEVSSFFAQHHKNNMIATGLRWKGDQLTEPDFAVNCDVENSNGIHDCPVKYQTQKCDRDYTRPADPSWGAALILLPFAIYSNTGDAEPLRESFEAMSAWLTSVTGRANPKTGLLDYGDFGDWNCLSCLETPLVETYMLFRLQRTMETVSDLLGEKIEAERWRRAADYTVEKFDAAFYFPSTSHHDNCGEYRGGAFGLQAANALAAFDFLAPNAVARSNSSAIVNQNRSSTAAAKRARRRCVLEALARHIIDGDVWTEHCSPIPPNVSSALRHPSRRQHRRRRRQNKNTNKPDKKQSHFSSILSSSSSSQQQTAKKRCVPGHLSTGIISWEALFYALSSSPSDAHHALALQLANQETFPSIGFFAARGATTLWENWQEIPPARSALVPDVARWEQQNYEYTEGASHNHQMLTSSFAWWLKAFCAVEMRPAPAAEISPRRRFSRFVEMIVVVDLSRPRRICAALLGHNTTASIVVGRGRGRRRVTVAHETSAGGGGVESSVSVERANEDDARNENQTATQGAIVKIISAEGEEEIFSGDRIGKANCFTKCK